MFEHPWWLAALALLPIVRWLHRFRAAGGAQPVAAAFLWRGDAVSDLRGARSQPPDPAWRRRAVIVALLVLALAGARWPATRGAPVVVWVDDSQSLYARDVGDTRMARALRALSAALDDARPVRIELRSLADPAVVLDLTSMSASSRAQALAEWTRAPRGEPHLPLPVALAPQSEHWLLTDGADADIARWAQSARLARIVQAGSECTNTAVTALALRTPIGADSPLAGLVEVTNACDAPVQRRLQVHTDAGVVLDESIALAPAARLQRRFTVSGVARVRAALDAGDSLALDDVLELDGAALAPVATRLTGACPASVEAALRAHPRLALGSADPVLEIDCSDGRSPHAGVRRMHLQTSAATQSVNGPLAWIGAGTLATLALDPQWLRRVGTVASGRALLADGDVPLIVRTDDGLDVGLAFGVAPFDTRPEHAALFAGLIDETLGRELLGEIARASLPASAARIAPLPAPAPAPHAYGNAAASTLPAASLLVGAALLLLLYDLARTRGSWPRIARSVVALTCLLALWNPANPFRRAPIDLSLLLDASQSMPAGAAEAAWQALRDEALPKGSRVHVTRFGAAPVDEGTFAAHALPPQPPARLALDATRTNVAEALAQSLRDSDAAHSRVVVLASDGEENAGDAATLLAQAHAAGVPVLLLPPEGVAPVTASIARVAAPANARTGRRMPLTVRVTTAGAATLEVDDGERVVSARIATGTGAWLLWLEPSTQRSRQLRLRLLAANGSVLDEHEETLALAGDTSVLVVTRIAPSAIAESLSTGGWRVVTTAPSGMQQALAGPDPVDVVILDDIAAEEAGAAAWDALARAVHVGAGLAVLGGPHSFMAGGYHDATIETVLPVICAPPRPQAPAAVLFVIDKSGSMGRATSLGATRFELARQAVMTTAAALPASDSVGLLAFDVSPQVAHPLAPGGASALERAWTFTASGGTALAPALDEAITALANAQPAQRLLVLATDGFVLDESLDALVARIERAHIDVIALAIGDEPDLSVLERLTEPNAGALLPVRDVAALPRLIGGELAVRRASVQTGPIEPVLRVPLPFFATQAWPVLDAYAVTTARPGAQVYLASALGDPLLAAQDFGAGRVLALTGGLGPWANAWQGWPRTPALLGGLVDWLVERTSLRVHARFDERASEPRLEIDAVDAQRWSEAPAARVSWVDPAGDVRVIEADATAPGRYTASLPAREIGEYRAWIDVGGLRTVGHYTHAAQRERHPDDAARAAPGQWLRSGLLQRWPDGLEGARRPPGTLREPLLALALAALIALLLWERRPGWRSGRSVDGIRAAAISRQ